MGVLQFFSLPIPDHSSSILDPRFRFPIPDPAFPVKQLAVKLFLHRRSILSAHVRAILEQLNPAAIVYT